jgi:hypothetical protein
MSITNIPKLERFFRLAASLDIDKDDLARYDEFLNHKVYDLLLRAQAAATANARDIIFPQDLPLTKGLQERIHEFRNLDQQIGLKPVLDQLIKRPMLDLGCNEETDSALSEIAGGLSVALARSFKIIDPDLKNPTKQHWEREFALFDLLL